MRYEKLSPGVAAAFHQATEPWPGSRLANRVAVMAMEAFPAEMATPAVRVFIRCQPDVSSERWAPLGVSVNSGRGTIRTASVPLSALESLSEDDAVERIVAGQRLRPRLDVAGPAANLPSFVRQSGLSGRGVVVGVVDSGLDGTHPAFAGRVHRVWDQTVSGPGVPGRSATGMEVAAAMSTDQHGHGTHVTSIAAGADSVYPGVAPEATIVAVKTTFLNTDILDGVRYVFGIADELGMPAVVNLSLGGHNDPHDGTDSFCVALDIASGPGRLICAAAGNEGQTAIHSEFDLREGALLNVDVVVPGPSEGPVEIAFINAWYPAGNTLSVSVRSPAGGAAPPQGPIHGGPFTARTTLADGVVLVSTPPANPDNGDFNVVVELQPAPGAAAVTPGRWVISFTCDAVSSGELHLWAIAANDSVTLQGGVADRCKIGAPGAGSRVITVGAQTSRTAWTDIGGAARAMPFTVGQLAPFSSPGPLRDGSNKPNLSAPGSMIIAARSSQSRSGPPFQVDATHVAMQGTSMATPFVSGLVALLLQRDGSLDPAGANAALTAACQIPGRPAKAVDERWGAGMIDAGML